MYSGSQGILIILFLKVFKNKKSLLSSYYFIYNKYIKYASQLSLIKIKNKEKHSEFS